MTMKIKKITYAVFMLLPLAVAAVALLFLPEQIPAHYGAGMAVDRWGSKFESLIFPLETAGFGLLMILLAKLAGKVEEKNNKNKNNENITLTIGLVILIVFNALDYYFIYAALNNVTDLSEIPVDIYSLVVLLFGIALVIIGNILPKTRKNSLIGFRTAWTMKNDITWKKCQLFGGITMIISGLLVALGGMFVFKGISAIFYMLAVLAVMMAADAAYSYFIMKKYGGDYAGVEDE